MNSKTFTLHALQEAISSQPNAALLFTANGETIRAGYHVTEVKFAQVQSMDCGRGKDQWNEITIQLLDGPAKSGGNHMIGSKFNNIVTAACASLPQKAEAQLFFEFSPDNNAVQKLQINAIEAQEDCITVSLRGTSAICKPFERAMSATSTPVTSDNCCNSVTESDKCCGDSRSVCCG